jgi:tetratricopeptide (TPR) repeat protein
MRWNHNFLLRMTLLLALAPVAAAQRPAPQPIVNPVHPTVHSSPGDYTAVITNLNNGSPQPEIQRQRKDTCLLPPLDSTRSSVIRAAQLRIPIKARKEYQKACSALTTKKSTDAESHLRKAVQDYPKYAAAWVTLGQVLADEHKSEDARNACAQAATVDPMYLPAHLCLAEIASRSQEWSEEVKHSSRALELDPSSVLAYEYHAGANANLGNLSEAERSGLRAVALDKNHHEPSVFFVLGIVYELKGDAAREEEQFRNYVRYTHDRERAARVKQILAKLEKSQGGEIQEGPTFRDTSARPAQRWELTDVDEAVPSVIDDTTCPLAQVLQEASQRGTELVENLQRFTADEQIEDVEFRKNGKPRNSTSERFSYLAEIAENPYGSYWVYEYRTAKGPTARLPLTDTGTAALGLIFHPKMIGKLEIHCEGRTDLKGTSAWQLRFEERPDPSNPLNEFAVNGSAYQVRLKGRAWISADNYQVLRLQTGLVAPIPEIHLEVYHSDIIYSPVDFVKHKFQLWLPQSAAMQVEYQGHRYQRVHSFSHFQLFQVDTEQRVTQPVAPPPKSASEQ